MNKSIKLNCLLSPIKSNNYLSKKTCNSNISESMNDFKLKLRKGKFLASFAKGKSKLFNENIITNFTENNTNKDKIIDKDYNLDKIIETNNNISTFINSNSNDNLNNLSYISNELNNLLNVLENILKSIDTYINKYKTNINITNENYILYCNNLFFLEINKIITNLVYLESLDCKVIVFNITTLIFKIIVELSYDSKDLVYTLLTKESFYNLVSKFLLNQSLDINNYNIKEDIFISLGNMFEEFDFDLINFNEEICDHTCHIIEKYGDFVLEQLLNNVCNENYNINNNNNTLFIKRYVLWIINCFLVLIDKNILLYENNIDKINKSNLLKLIKDIITNNDKYLLDNKESKQIISEDFYNKIVINDNLKCIYVLFNSFKNYDNLNEKVNSFFLMDCNSNEDNQNIMIIFNQLLFYILKFLNNRSNEGLTIVINSLKIYECIFCYFNEIEEVIIYYLLLNILNFIILAC